jgi:hypothetical protein
MNKYADYVNRRDALKDALSKFILELSPLKTYEEGDVDMALFEKDVLNKSLELYFKFEEEYKDD